MFSNYKHKLFGKSFKSSLLTQKLEKINLGQNKNKKQKKMYNPTKCLPNLLQNRIADNTSLYLTWEPIISWVDESVAIGLLVILLGLTTFSRRRFQILAANALNQFLDAHFGTDFVEILHGGWDTYGSLTVDTLKKLKLLSEKNLLALILIQKK